jgi:hypothetical protein
VRSISDADISCDFWRSSLLRGVVLALIVNGSSLLGKNFPCRAVEAHFHDYDLTGFDGSRHFRRTHSGKEKSEEV